VTKRQAQLIRTGADVLFQALTSLQRCHTQARFSLSPGTTLVHHSILPRIPSISLSLSLSLNHSTIQPFNHCRKKTALTIACRLVCSRCSVSPATVWCLAHHLSPIQSSHHHLGHCSDNCQSLAFAVECRLLGTLSRRPSLSRSISRHHSTWTCQATMVMPVSSSMSVRITKSSSSSRPLSPERNAPSRQSEFPLRFHSRREEARYRSAGCEREGQG
jgi:hypothetical protein